MLVNIFCLVMMIEEHEKVSIFKVDAGTTPFLAESVLDDIWNHIIWYENSQTGQDIRSFPLFVITTIPTCWESESAIFHRLHSRHTAHNIRIRSHQVSKNWTHSAVLDFLVNTLGFQYPFWIFLSLRNHHGIFKDVRKQRVRHSIIRYSHEHTERHQNKLKSQSHNVHIMAESQARGNFLHCLEV